jgi:hypothetical protein
MVSALLLVAAIFRIAAKISEELPRSTRLDFNIGASSTL